MRIVSLYELPFVEIGAHASVGFTLSPLTKGEGVLVITVRLSPGGRIGRHPAVGRQILAVLEGAGVVSGYDGIEHALLAGSVAVWEPGETHETRTSTGLTALVIEGDLELLATD